MTLSQEVVTDLPTSCNSQMWSSTYRHPSEGSVLLSGQGPSERWDQLKIRPRGGIEWAHWRSNNVLAAEGGN